MKRPSYWVIKTEPSEYSFDDLVREKRTVWEGVANVIAKNNLREMKVGDLALVYHTGNEKRTVGIAEVVERGDPPTLAAKQRLVTPVTLKELKADKLFEDSALVRIGRLSVIPISAAQWRFLGGTEL